MGMRLQGEGQAITCAIIFFSIFENLTWIVESICSFFSMAPFAQFFSAIFATGPVYFFFGFHGSIHYKLLKDPRSSPFFQHNIKRKHMIGSGAQTTSAMGNLCKLWQREALRTLLAVFIHACGRL